MDDVVEIARLHSNLGESTDDIVARLHREHKGIGDFSEPTVWIGDQIAVSATVEQDVPLRMFD